MMTDRDLTGLLSAHSTSPSRSNVDAWRDELDGFLSMMQQWSQIDPGTVMMQISSIAARLIEIRSNVVRSENRTLQAFRTKELDPLLDQVEFQFKIHSRRVSSMSLEWDMAKGG